MEISDWISISAIVVNSGLAVWLVITLQSKLTNNRVLKDHLINEVLEVRSIIQNKIEKIHASKETPRHLISWFKLMNVKQENLMRLINSKYGIDKDLLKPFQVELRVIITEDEGYIASFRDNKKIELTASTKERVIIFLQKNTHLFTNVIVKINDA